MPAGNFVRAILSEQEHNDMFPCFNCNQNHLFMRYDAVNFRYSIECNGKPFCGLQVNGLPLRSFGGDYSQARQSAINLWQAINGDE